MPAVLEVAICDACGGVHVLCLAGGEVTNGQSYQFTCPGTGRPVTFRASARGEGVDTCPPGSVAMRPAD